MSKLFAHRWGFGLGAIAGTAAVILIIALAVPNVQARAAEVMARGARAIAKLTSVHLRGQLRSAPQENFSNINADEDFHPIELWAQLEPQLKWRVEKPERVAAMDGQSTVMLIKPGSLAVKAPAGAKDPFDTGWLQSLASLSNTLTNELNHALAKGWKLSLTEERAADGRLKAIVSIDAKSGVPDNDYLKNAFMMDADTRRVYRFDAETELLEAVQIYLVRKAGETLLFELQQIEYNHPIEPTVFQLELPANVRWWQTEMQMLPDNEKYAAMTPEQAARAYFEAFASRNWTEAEKFRRETVDESTQQLGGGLQIISIGTAFTAQNYPGRFVPYEIKLSDGDVMKHNLALKKDGKTGRWFVDGGSF